MQFGVIYNQMKNVSCGLLITLLKYKEVLDLRRLCHLEAVCPDFNRLRPSFLEIGQVW